MNERKQALETTTAGFRRTRSSLMPSAADCSTAVQSLSPTSLASRTSFFRVDEDGSPSSADFAALLGIGVQDRDASRIIMAAQVRLRLLRRSQPSKNVRDQAKQIVRARDALLRSVVEAARVPAAAPVRCT